MVCILDWKDLVMLNQFPLNLSITGIYSSMLRKIGGHAEFKCEVTDYSVRQSLALITILQ